MTNLQVSGDDWDSDDWGNTPWADIENIHEIILDKVNFLDILDKYDIEYSKSFSGSFSHKLKCPLLSHLDGRERTASFFISESHNSFYCFGCNAGGTVIDFVKLYDNICYNEVVDKLFKYIDIKEIDTNIPNVRERVNPEFTIAFYVLKSGITIREHLKTIKDTKNSYKWYRWADKRFVRLDFYLDKLEDKQWEVVKKYYQKITNFIEKNK